MSVRRVHNVIVVLAAVLAAMVVMQTQTHWFNTTPRPAPATSKPAP